MDLSSPVKCTMCMQYRSRAVIRVFTMVFTASPIPANQDPDLPEIVGMDGPVAAWVGRPKSEPGRYWWVPSTTGWQGLHRLPKCPTDTIIT